MFLPRRWRTFPRAEEIFHFKPIRDLIDAPTHCTITAQHFAQAMLNLSDFLESLMEAKTWRYFQLMQESLPGDIKVAPRQVPLQVAMQSLSLATAVFECRQTIKIRTHRHPFIITGLEELLSHHCDVEDSDDEDVYRPSTHKITFSHWAPNQQES
ncbi:hypothetical protein CPB84DRAFT_912165 [Gymnopilus junonius]|uniref:Uncharacterized protein n=1 Tax=Gymnopilus junonius TaxID=109634 RepID=A0A9P5NRZ0_GYMJU|nr:hypothetical protein CPB84DRAFT_912165 [Gymnopilus junonius]